MLTIAPGKILRILLVAAHCFILAYVLTRVFHSQLSMVKLGHLRSIFNADSEQNVPTWFSSMLLLTDAAILGVITRIKVLQHDPYRWHWAGLALIFVGLSIDEQVSIHEYLNDVRKYIDVGGMLYFAWVIPAIGALIWFGLIFLRFWLALPTASRIHFALAGLIYIGGAVGMEIISAPMYEQGRNGTMLYLLFTSIEELCEMCGAAIFVYALLAYIRDHMPETGVIFAPPTNVEQHSTGNAVLTAKTIRPPSSS